MRCSPRLPLGIYIIELTASLVLRISSTYLSDKRFLWLSMFCFVILVLNTTYLGQIKRCFISRKFLCTKIVENYSDLEKNFRLKNNDSVTELEAATVSVPPVCLSVRARMYVLRT